MNKNTTIGIKKPLEGGAVAAAGFVVGSAACGLGRGEKRDVGVLFSERSCTSAAVYTRNVVRGAPLGVTRDSMAGGGVRAVVANSGNANAATGEGGLRDAYEMRALAARALGISESEVAVASTGVVGERLPMELLSEGIGDAVAGLGRDGRGFAEAITTTDTRLKQAAVEVEVGGVAVTVGGTAKGSGMIHPNMGTMLAFMTTDAAVEGECLQDVLGRAVDRTFNRVTVDGDTSPSDMGILLANGAAGGEEIRLGSGEHEVFAGAVEWVARDLARQIARDGEGASRLVEVVVQGARNEEEAAALARSIVGSSLVKAAVFGEDANWGRALVAMGYAGVAFDPDEVELSFGDVRVFAGGEPVAHDAAEANAALAGEEVTISARVGGGEGSATAWGCDLTYGYVEINGSYRT
jgi:glutamate N-acetyltransferase / amino-acid N-acetyltransferase